MTSEAAAGSVTGAEEGKDMSPRSQPRRRWEAPDTVIAVSAALVAIIVGVFVLLCVQGYHSTIANTKERAVTAASIVAEETRWVFASVRTSLNHLATLMEGEASTAEALSAFEAATTAIPMEMRVGVYDETGALVSGGSGTEPVRTAIGGNDFFDTLANGAPWGLSAQERDPETGEATFAVARRLGTAGQFEGAAVAFIDAAVLRRLSESLDLGENSTISIVRSDGWIIARNPSLAEPMNISDTQNFDYLEATASGSYSSEFSPADGFARIVGFQQVRDLGYIAVASIATDTVLAGLWSSIWIVSLLIAPIAIALLVGSLLTARLLRRTQSTSRSLAAALEHNETLFREIHHRVKNNLQSVNSLLQLHPIPREVRADMSQRIAAMSAVHEHIYRSNTFSQVRVKNYLHTLIGSIRAGYGGTVDVIEDIHDVAVEKDAATPLGLIVNEVVSNCFKHAFSDGRAGVVTVSLKAVGDGNAELSVRDNGVGFDPDTPGKGIGRRLVRGFAAQLHGEANHTSDNGSVFTLTFPLARD